LSASGKSLGGNAHVATQSLPEHIASTFLTSVMRSDAEDEKPATSSTEVATRDGLLGALASATKPEQQAALREDQITNAVGFLTNQKVVVRNILPYGYLHDF
jgi:hypothetical protein